VKSGPASLTFVIARTSCAEVLRVQVGFAGRSGTQDDCLEEHADVEAVVAHQPPRSARGIIGGATGAGRAYVLPVALLRTERDARAQYLD
jgi:hypothetical protein